MLKKLTVFLIIAFFTFPMLYLIQPIFLQSKFEASSLIFRYSINSIILSVCTGILSYFIGISLAIIVTFFDFPGKNFLKIMLVFPIAIPLYISAISYTYFLDYTPYLYYFISLSKFFGLKGIKGQIMLMSLSFYPYIYTIACSKMSMMNETVIIAKTLGKSHLSSILKIVLPMSRASTISALALVVMEVISDFTTSSVFGVDTFATGIYRSWFLMDDIVLASKMIVMLLLFIVIIFSIEKNIHDKTYISPMNPCMDITTLLSYKIHGFKKYFASAYCILIFFFAFLLPIIPIIHCATTNISQMNYSILVSIRNSVFISFIASIFIVSLAVYFCIFTREQKKYRYITNLASIGYTIPSIVVTFGVMMFLSRLSATIDTFISIFIKNKTHTIILVGSIFALLYTYVFRFIAIAISSTEGALKRIPMEVDWSAKLMGRNVVKTCISLHIPTISRSILTSFVLVFLDIMKEISSTIIIRPMNFDTLAIKIYDLINDEQYIEATVPSLIMCIVSITSMMLLIRSFNNKKLNYRAKSNTIEVQYELWK